MSRLLVFLCVSVYEYIFFSLLKGLLTRDCDLGYFVSMKNNDRNSLLARNSRKIAKTQQNYNFTEEQYQKSQFFLRWLLKGSPDVSHSHLSQITFQLKSCLDTVTAVELLNQPERKNILYCNLLTRQISPSVNQPISILAQQEMHQLNCFEFKDIAQRYPQ